MGLGETWTTVKGAITRPRNSTIGESEEYNFPPSTTMALAQ